MDGSAGYGLNVKNLTAFYNVLCNAKDARQRFFVAQHARPEQFTMFFDFDIKVPGVWSDEELARLVQTTTNCLAAKYKWLHVDIVVTACIADRSLHLHVPNVTVSQHEAIALRADVVHALDAQEWDLPTTFDKYVDTSVYKPPKLRVPGADKAQQCACSPTADVVDRNCSTCGGKGRVNLGRAYNFRAAFKNACIDVATTAKLRSSLFHTLMACSISSNEPLTSGAPVVPSVKATTAPIVGKLAECMRGVLEARGMPCSGLKITAKPDVLFVDVVVQDFVCGNVNRAHRRNGPFFIVRRSGYVQQRCRDDECSKKGAEYVVDLARLLPSETEVLFPDAGESMKYPDNVRLWMRAAVEGPIKRKRAGQNNEKGGKGGQRKGGKGSNGDHGSQEKDVQNGRIGGKNENKWTENTKRAKRSNW
jgi:hypothetical protein